MATISLSFDNGPDPAATPTVLTALARRNIQAIFFVVGQNAAADHGPSLMQETVSAGHRLGNHTWSHSVPLGRMADPAESVDEIRRTQAAMGDLAEPAMLFRPFGGGGARGPHLLSAAAYDHLVANAYTCVLWNCVPGDFSDATGWVDRARTQIAETAEPFLVLHDIAGACAERLEDFLDEMLDAGHTFAPTVPAGEILIDRGTPRSDAQDYVTGA